MVESKRAEILDAAFSRFRQYGFHKSTVERYIGPNYEGTAIWQLEQLPDGVKVSYVYDAADTGWVSKLIYRVARTRAHHHFYSHALERLKHHLEAESP